MRSSALNSARSNRNSKFLISDSNLNESVRSFINDDEDENIVMNDSDVKCLKNNILFKYMNSEKVYTLIKENTICLKKKKYKEIVGQGLECQDNIYIVKNGEMNVWIKMTNTNVKGYQEKIDKYHVQNQKDYSNFSKQKARFRRDALVDLISNKNALSSERPSYINVNSTSDFTASTTASRFGQASTMNLSTNRSGFTSRVTTANTTRLGPYTPRLSANKNVQSLSSKNILQRPTTVNISKKISMEELRTPCKNNTYRYAVSAAPQRSKVEPSQKTSSENITKNFDLNLKAIQRHNSGKTSNHTTETDHNTETNTIKSLKTMTETCTEFSEETVNDFDFPTRDLDSESRVELLSVTSINQHRQRPATGKKQLRIAEEETKRKSESAQANANKSAYVKLMQLIENQIFGLSDLIFNNKNVYKENFTVENNRVKGFNQSEGDNHLNGRNLNSYILICSSRTVEYYVINKSVFINNMTDTEKFFFQSQLENMQKLCPQIPSNETITGNYNERQKWNNYKKKVYNEALKSRSSNKFNVDRYRPKTVQVSSAVSGENVYRNMSNVDLIRNSRVHVKNSNNHNISQNFNFHLSNEIIAQRRNNIHEVHSGKSRFRF